MTDARAVVLGRIGAALGDGRAVGTASASNHTTPAPGDVDDPPLGVEALDATGTVLTGCAQAIAETGTIVLDGGPRCGRRALTLVPDHHVCVVHADQVVATVVDAIAAMPRNAPITLVSGPSATSDIELERVEGVHGPRRLDVVVVL